MNASYQDQKVKNSKKKGNPSVKQSAAHAFVLWLVGIGALYILFNHFIEKWDGHFHDTKGCTFLQSMNSRIYKVNSCDNSVVPMDADTVMPAAAPTPPVKTFNQVEPDTSQALPLPPKTLIPPKKLPHGEKDGEPPKQSPYMI